MPQSNNKSKKKGHQPAHQNTFAFRHNPKSKLTAKILSSPNVGLCRRCHDKIEWRKQYRKYKPLSQPSTCNICKKRNVKAAYHTICDGCAESDLAWKKMLENGDSATVAKSSVDDNSNNNDVNGQCKNSNSHNVNTKHIGKVCAMCVKEPAKDDDNINSTMEAQIEEKIRQMEEKLNRPLKLRESKAIERKIQRDHEREKERLKEERRRARDEAAGIIHDDNVSDQKDDDDDDDDDDDLEEGDDVESHDDSDSKDNESRKDSEEDDDINDPFLQAIGGQEKMLTGEAYQQMLLEKERLEKIKLSN